MRNPYNGYSSDKTERAKSLLCHYFQISNGDSLDEDCCTEIGEIVDCILEAVEQRSTEYKLRQAETSLKYVERDNRDMTELLKKASSLLEVIASEVTLNLSENPNNLHKEIEGYFQE